MLQYDDGHYVVEGKENKHYHGEANTLETPETPETKSTDELLELFGADFLSIFDTKNITNANSTNNITITPTIIVTKSNRHNNNNNNTNTTVPLTTIIEEEPNPEISPL